MTGTGRIESAVIGVAGKLQACERCRLRRKRGKGEYCLPSRKAVHEVLDAFIGILFPGCHGHGAIDEGMTESGLLEQLKSNADILHKQARMGFEYKCELDQCEECDDCDEKALSAVVHLLESLPVIQAQLQDDIEAAFEGDPAAKSPMEVVMSYPAIQAISVYRIAHLLHENEVPLIPRIMTELAHSRTGIDIHPGAQIGRRFFIDHGTGVVIGETTIIGDNVKIYQGVTLGAMSFPKDDDGKPIKGIKRHPNVGDNVTIYAEATILGGNTTIGEGSEIGGNVWLTKSVPPDSKVYNIQPDPYIR
jgi:serine O-acetyltransferase